MTISAGVCDLPHAGDADELYRLADGALYWAKHHGRDMVLRYSPDGASGRRRRAPTRTRPTPPRAPPGARRACAPLARAVDAKDRRPGGTRSGSPTWRDAIARSLGVAAGPRRALREAALLHDVGKIGVPERSC